MAEKHSKIKVRIIPFVWIPFAELTTESFGLDQLNSDYSDSSISWSLDEAEPDFVLVINKIPFDTPNDVTVAPENIICLALEPPENKEVFDRNGHKQFHKFLACTRPVDRPKYEIHPPVFQIWSHRANEYFTNHNVLKTKEISVIASNITDIPGHRKRLSFLQTLRQLSHGAIEFFGRGTNPVQDKYDALLPYKYSVAIENSSIDNYFTEKITDCFVAETLPFYYGCTNIAEYFPQEALIWIDIEKQEQAWKTMQTAIANNEFEKRIDHIREAREIYLRQFHPASGFANIVKKYYDPTATKRKIKLKPYRAPLPFRFINKIRRQLIRMISKTDTLLSISPKQDV